MNKSKTILFTAIISTLIFTGCNQQEKTTDGINIPERDTNAKIKSESHNKIAKAVYNIGIKARKLKEDFNTFQDPKETEKPTIEDLKKQYEELFKKSEELRKTTETAKDITKIYKPFESDYLPQLDILLNSFKELTQNPKDQERYKAVKENFKNYYKKHNKYVEILNQNIYY